MKSISPYKPDDKESSRQAAIQLIKERIKLLYGNERPIEPRPKSELVSRFWEQHKDDPNPQAAWQRFYSGLSDEDKLSLWDQYHTTKAPETKPRHGKTHDTEKAHGVNSHGNHSYVITNDDTHAANLEPTPKEKTKTSERLKSMRAATVADKKQLLKNLKSSTKRRKTTHPLNHKKSHKHWRPLMISVIIMAIWLLAQYNPLLIAFAKQYVSPGDTLRSPVIVDPNLDIEISDEPRIIIPKINVDVPVVYNLGTRDEATIQSALEEGVVHYAGTGVPGKAGNNVIVGHSSNNFLNSGKYKFAFVLLERLELGDTFILHYEGTRYVYKVTNEQIIEPTDFSLTLPTSKPTVTLITCTPPGTSWKRLVIQGEQISPAPKSSQIDQTPTEEVIETPEVVPGNAPSFWDRLTGWF